MVCEKPSILIADDDDGDRKQIKRVLKKMSMACHIEEAKDMDEALRICSERHIEFAFLDYKMPGNDRLEGLRQLHGRNPYTSIILMTGQGDEEVASQAIKTGAVDYTSKRSITSDSIRRMLEYARERTKLQKKLDEQRRSLEEFSHILVHDLSAPIRHISMFSELISKAVAKQDYEELGELSDRIGKASVRMKDLIATLSIYNKIDTTSVPFKKVPMQHVVDEAIASLGGVLLERRAQVTCDSLLQVYGNVPQLVQLMQNLISNGIKFCEQATPEIHISSCEEHEEVRICVADNGIGIDESFHKTIFAPFKRLHSMSHEKYVGSGLGLSTCKKIIERHKGQIWCESEQGKGANFYFTLPVKLSG